MTDRSTEVRAALAAMFIVLASGSFFFASPLLAYGDINSLAICGTLLATAAGGFWAALHRSDRLLLQRMCMGMFFISMAGLTYFLTQAGENYKANLVRCADLQQDMIALEPRRPDSADLFQAFKCQPFGYERVQFPDRN